MIRRFHRKDFLHILLFAVMIMAANYSVRLYLSPISVKFEYLKKSQYLDEKELQKTWKNFLEKNFQQQQSLQKTVSLYRLSPNEFIPISIYSNISRFKNLEYWGKTSIKIDEKSLIVVGPKGILGRADQVGQGYFRLTALTSSKVQLPVTTENNSNVMIIEGKNGVFQGKDYSEIVKIGDVLITLGCDPHYPPLYPVAIITSLEDSLHGKIFYARPLEEFKNISYGILYKPQEKKIK